MCLRRADPGAVLASAVEIIVSPFPAVRPRLSHDESVAAGWQSGDYVITVGMSHHSGDTEDTPQIISNCDLFVINYRILVKWRLFQFCRYNSLQSSGQIQNSEQCLSFNHYHVYSSMYQPGFCSRLLYCLQLKSKSDIWIAQCWFMTGIPFVLDELQRSSAHTSTDIYILFYNRSRAV